MSGYNQTLAKAYAAGADPNDLFSPTGGYGDTGRNTAASVKLKQNQASKAEIETKLLEHKYAVETGKYLPREAFRDATTTLLAHVAQGLRSLPDLLERKCALPPDAVELVQREVDARLLELSEGLRQYTEITEDDDDSDEEAA
jgi:hypothetical protein